MMGITIARAVGCIVRKPRNKERRRNVERPTRGEDYDNRLIWWPGKV